MEVCVVVADDDPVKITVAEGLVEAVPVSEAVVRLLKVSVEVGSGTKFKLLPTTYHFIGKRWG